MADGISLGVKRVKESDCKESRWILSSSGLDIRDVKFSAPLHKMLAAKLLIYYA
jgi:hypothetical protein